MWPEWLAQRAHDLVVELAQRPAHAQELDAEPGEQDDEQQRVKLLTNGRPDHEPERKSGCPQEGRSLRRDPPPAPAPEDEASSDHDARRADDGDNHSVHAPERWIIDRKATTTIRDARRHPVAISRRRRTGDSPSNTAVIAAPAAATAG